MEMTVETTDPQISSMHAAWSANGAQEFVPSALRAAEAGAQQSQTVEYDPRGYQHHGVPMYPGMAAGHWPSAMPVPNPWQLFPGMGMGMMMGPTALTTPMPQPKSLVAMWNLSTTYTKETIKNELAELDLTPVKVRMCPEIQGACVLVCAEVWVANALTIMLDMTKDILQVADDKPLRAAKCTYDLSKLLAEDVPYELRKALIREAKQES